MWLLKGCSRSLTSSRTDTGSSLQANLAGNSYAFSSETGLWEMGDKRLSWAAHCPEMIADLIAFPHCVWLVSQSDSTGMDALRPWSGPLSTQRGGPPTACTRLPTVLLRVQIVSCSVVSLQSIESPLPPPTHQPQPQPQPHSPALLLWEVRKPQTTLLLPSSPAPSHGLHSKECLEFTTSDPYGVSSPEAGKAWKEASLGWSWHRALTFTVGLWT